MANTAALHAANASSNLVKAIPLNFFLAPIIFSATIVALKPTFV
jgi:hypothetical protein